MANMTPEMREVVRETVRQTVRETFLTMGIEADDPLEVQKDFQHLREWRLTTESVKRKGLITLAGLLVSGAVAALWMGLKYHLSQLR